MGLPLATREAVLDALDAAETTRSAAQVDRLIDAASRSVEALTHRSFHPVRATRYFPWPNDQMGASWRLWLDGNELISVETITSGGAAVDDYFLEPQQSGPPYNRVEIDLGSSTSAFETGASYQRAIAITGLWGYGADTWLPTTLASTVTGGAVWVSVTNASGIGVGDLLRIDNEYLLVTGRGWDTSGQTQQADLAASKGDTALTVTDGSAFAAGEALLLGSERMRISAVAGNTLVVERAQDGTVLAAHSGATVYAGRALTVTRARCGTTAAAHSGGSEVAVHEVPAAVRSLVVAEAMWALQNEQSGMARVIGSGELARQVNASAIRDQREQVRISHGRNARTRVI